MLSQDALRILPALLAAQPYLSGKYRSARSIPDVEIVCITVFPLSWEDTPIAPGSIYRKCARGLPTHPKGTRRQVNGAWPSLRFTNMSARVKGSRRHRKMARSVAQTHQKIERQRRDFHFKTAKRYANAYQTIVVEDLNIRGLARSRWAKAFWMPRGARF